MSATTYRTEDGRWLFGCAACGWLPGDDQATGYAAADHIAAVHNSETHLVYERPEWAEVAEWVREHRATAPA